MLCSFRVDGKVKRKRSVYDTTLNLSFFTHLSQLSSLYSSLHLGIYHFYCSQRCNLGILQSAGIAYGNGILNDMYLVLKGRISNKRNVCQEQKSVNAGDLKYSHVRKRSAGSKTNFLVQYTLQESLGIAKPLHVHVNHTVMCQLNCLQGSLCHIGLVDNLITCQIHINRSGNLSNLSLVTYQNCVCNSLCLCMTYSLQHSGVLCCCHCNLLHSAALNLCNNIIKTFDHFPASFLPRRTFHLFYCYYQNGAIPCSGYAR